MRTGSTLTVDWDAVPDATKYVVTVERGDGAIRSYPLEQPAAPARRAGRTKLRRPRTLLRVRGIPRTEDVRVSVVAGDQNLRFSRAAIAGMKAPQADPVVVVGFGSKGNPPATGPVVPAKVPTPSVLEPVPEGY